VADHVLEVFVVGVRLEAKTVFERHGERNDKVKCADFGEEVLLSEDGVGVALFGVHPDETFVVLRYKGELGPVFTSLVVALVGGGRAEAESETDDETEHCEEKLVDSDFSMSVIAR
jgi:hypothetical protein